MDQKLISKRVEEIMKSNEVQLEDPHQDQATENPKEGQERKNQIPNNKSIEDIPDSIQIYTQDVQDGEEDDELPDSVNKLKAGLDISEFQLLKSDSKAE